MKAITLISGGLDSILAAKVVKDQGVEVIPLNFKIPFCQRKKNAQPDNTMSSFVKNNLGEELRCMDISKDFMELVLNPKHGFGSNMNPCIDCKITMLKKAKELLGEWNAQFIVTGEVLGQRPMSQHRRALQVIEKDSALEGLLLRPLSAKLFPETVPEKELWVRREELFNFNGRSRRPQINLARKLGISDYPNSAGGCLLTDLQFSNRLRDLIIHRQLNIENVELLKIGRHFRLSASTKLIVGRNEIENKELEYLVKETDYLFIPDQDLAGPACLGRGEFNDQLVELSCQIMSRYCDLNGAKRARIIYYRKDNSVTTPCVAEALPICEGKLDSLRL